MGSSWIRTQIQKIQTQKKKKKKTQKIKNKKNKPRIFYKNNMVFSFIWHFHFFSLENKHTQT